MGNEGVFPTAQAVPVYVHWNQSVHWKPQSFCFNSTLVSPLHALCVPGLCDRFGAETHHSMQSDGMSKQERIPFTTLFIWMKQTTSQHQMLGKWRETRKYSYCVARSLCVVFITQFGNKTHLISLFFRAWKKTLNKLLGFLENDSNQYKKKTLGQNSGH